MQPSYLPTPTTASRTIGHAGMRTTGDGSLIIKPAFPTEHRFYEVLNRDPHLARLRPFIPKFLGTLSVDQGDGPTEVNGIPIPPGRTQSMILENLSNAFLKPNTLDVKLGTVFYDKFMAPDKVLRMERTARETTSLRTGVRLTEFQVSVAHDSRRSGGDARRRTEREDPRFMTTPHPKRCAYPSRMGKPSRYQSSPKASRSSSLSIANRPGKTESRRLASHGRLSYPSFEPYDKQCRRSVKFTRRLRYA